MNKILKYISFVFVGALVAFTITVFGASTYSVLRDPNNLPAKEGAQCTVSTAASSTVSAQSSTQILATSSTRAWARVSINNNATNTAFLAFNADAAATINNGVGLNLAVTNGASSTMSVDFGLTTAFPYTGSVQAITNFGGATLLITQCNY